MSERVFLVDQASEAERFRVEERQVLCAGCGVLCRGSLCRECEAVEVSAPLTWPAGSRRRMPEDGGQADE